MDNLNRAKPDKIESDTETKSGSYMHTLRKYRKIIDKARIPSGKVPRFSTATAAEIPLLCLFGGTTVAALSVNFFVQRAT